MESAQGPAVFTRGQPSGGQHHDVVQLGFKMYEGDPVRPNAAQISWAPLQHKGVQSTSC